MKYTLVGANSNQGNTSTKSSIRVGTNSNEGEIAVAGVCSCNMTD